MLADTTLSTVWEVSRIIHLEVTLFTYTKKYNIVLYELFKIVQTGKGKHS